jgi:hypothetical protein
MRTEIKDEEKTIEHSLEYTPHYITNVNYKE